MLFHGDVKLSFMKLLRFMFIGAILLVVTLKFFLLLHEESASILTSDLYYRQGNITIESIDHQTRAALGNKPFSRYEGGALGLGKHNNFSILELHDPFWQGRGIASGDFNNDNWQDIVLATNKGILLYKNLGTNEFVWEDVDIPGINNLNIILVAFVDIDNDGWQDIYITSFGGKNFFVLNDNRSFQNPTVLEVPNTGALLTQASSFIDLDRDGYLDFVNGNWFYGLNQRGVTSEKGAETNKLVMNKNLEFIEEDLRGRHGQTLSTLFSDFTNDNTPDLIVGNDFEEPDIFYSGDAIGELNEIKKTDNTIPISAFSTMSIDVADFNNDLYMDIYVGGRDDNPDSNLRDSSIDHCFEIRSIEEKRKCKKNLEMKEVIKNRSLEDCKDFASDKDRNDCMVLIMVNLAARGKLQDESLCGKIPASYSIQKLRCHDYFTLGVANVRHEEAIPQRALGNVLLRGSRKGVFEEVSREIGSAEGRWAWNAKFADLDNDEWQDIYIANGFVNERAVYSNIFFQNYGGQNFKNRQNEFGLENFNAISTYTYIDIDNDGDLDIVTVPVNGPINAYINNETQNNSITFEFRDNVGNHFGIGNKIYIYYGENSERHQVREIKSGGGFLSFDSPIAHFGLGKYDTVNRIELVWSTGEKTVIDKEFLANKKYVVARKK